MIKDTLPVSDGTVTATDMIWWDCEDGLVHEQADGGHWENIRRYPALYSINKPEGKPTMEERYA